MFIVSVFKFDPFNTESRVFPDMDVVAGSVAV